MATELEELVVKISADVSELVEGMGIAKTALGVFEGEGLLEGVKKFGEAISDLFHEMVVEGVKAAAADEEAFQRLNFVMAASGKYSEEASASMHEFAEELANTSKFSSAAVLSASALLEAMTGLGEEGLQKTTKAAADLATVLNVDLNTATMLLGRAFEGNVSMLKRHGIAVEEGTTNAQTFANALKAIGQFAGASEAALNTYSGATAHLSNSWEEMTKELGNAMVQNVALKGVINEVSELIIEGTEWLKKNEQGMKELVAGGIIIAISALQGLVESLNILYRVSSVTLLPIKLDFVALKGLIEAASDALHGNFAKALNDAKATAVEMGTTIKSSFSGVAHGSQLLNALDADLEKVGDKATHGFAQIAAGSDKMGQSFRNGAGGAQALDKEMLKLIEEGVKLAKQATQLDPRKKYDDEVKALTAAHNKMKISDSDYIQAKVNLKDEETKKIDELETAAFDRHVKRIEDLRSDDEVGNSDRISSERKTLQTMLDMEDHNSQSYMDNKKKLKDFDDEIDKQRLQAGMTALNNLAVFQNSKNSEMAAVGKAAAIAATTISTFQGATAAYSALAGIPIVGPELGFIAAAAAVAAGLANVAQISGVALATGLDTVPGIGSADNFPAMLQPGEGVLDAHTNKGMKNLADGNGPMIELLKGIHSRLGQMQGQGGDISVKIDGREIARATRDQSRSGRQVVA